MKIFYQKSKTALRLFIRKNQRRSGPEAQMRFFKRGQAHKKAGGQTFYLMESGKRKIIYDSTNTKLQYKPI